MNLSAQHYGPLPDPHLTQFYAEPGMKNLATTFRFQKYYIDGYPPMYLIMFYMRNKEWLPPMQNYDVYLVDDKNDTIRLRSMVYPETGREWIGYPYGFSTIYKAAIYSYYICAAISIIDNIDEFLCHTFVSYNIGDGFRKLDMREGNQKYIKKFNKRLKIASKRAEEVDDSTILPYYTEYLYRIGELKDE
jgi:hypothetical protein